MADRRGAAPRALVLDPADNVAVAVQNLPQGEDLAFDDRRVTLREPIGFGHKLALRPIAEGEVVRKYAEVIGIATTAIQPGGHVHVHNVVSARLPGPGESR